MPVLSRDIRQKMAVVMLKLEVTNGSSDWIDLSRNIACVQSDNARRGRGALQSMGL